MVTLASTGAITAVWVLSLAAGAGVLLVTAILLTAILRVVRRIEADVGRLGGVVTRISTATSKVGLLDPIIATTAELEDSGGSIAMATSRIMMHAAVCPGCPACRGNRG